MYIVMQLLITVAEQGNAFTGAKVEEMQEMLQPTGSDVNTFDNLPIVGGITKAWDYFKRFIEIVFLWSPTMWSGNWVWFWWVFCFPIACGMIASVVSMIRGVSSG